MEEELQRFWHQLEDMMFEVENIEDEDKRAAVMGRLEDAQVNIEDALSNLRD
jgi:hypothetical protein